MIKKLRFKFICVIMAIVTVLMGVILGVVVHFTMQNMEAQSVSVMQSIASMSFQPGDWGVFPEEDRPPFFVVQIGHRGEVINATGEDYDRSDWEFLQSIVDHAMDIREDSGVLEDHGLRFLKTASPFGASVIFSDMTEELASRKEFVLTSLLLYLFAMAVFWGISIFLSHLMIQPVSVAWDQQRQFVADASHELKTPLAVIMANAELMQGEDVSKQDLQKHSGNILSTTYQMRGLVENMLEMARVDNGSLKMEFAELDLSQLVTDAVLSFQLLYEEKGLGLDSSVPEDIRIHGSEQHLYQVMDVLLDNALKYSTPASTVRVALSVTGRSCLLTVASSGDAISKEDLKNIFKRFYRADKARAMNGSYGLGLSIAESIVEAHHGKIWAESANGTNTFFVRLPQ